LIRPAVIIFFSIGSLLLINIIFVAIAMKQTNSTDFLDLLSCIGDGFTLFAYALAIACSLQEEKNVVDASISEEKPGETL
jgi:hypothetical protein